MKHMRRRTVLGAIGATSIGSFGLYELSARIAPRGDPTLTIAALSLRLADHLDERLSS